jgi:hypothetical protein
MSRMLYDYQLQVGSNSPKLGCVARMACASAAVVAATLLIG